jgi:hypothetical protein
MSSLKIAVITGGHPFDVQPFHHLFRSLPGINAFIQHIDEFASESQEVRDNYDAFVFYLMLKETPKDDGLWFTGKPKSTFDRLGQTKQGIVLLHHALLAYPDWEKWDDLAGMKSRIMRSYHQNQLVKVEVTDTLHPIVKGISAWEVIDETYVMDNAIMPENVPGNRIFLTTENPLSMKAFGWTRKYQQARVFCFPSGHGFATYENLNFQTVLANGIHWSVGS